VSGDVSLAALLVDPRNGNLQRVGQFFGCEKFPESSWCGCCDFLADQLPDFSNCQRHHELRIRAVGRLKSMAGVMVSTLPNFTATGRYKFRPQAGEGADVLAAEGGDSPGWSPGGRPAAIYTIDPWQLRPFFSRGDSAMKSAPNFRSPSLTASRDPSPRRLASCR
jgi:hypothetical protein